jgi:hypothetical protein
MTSFAQEDEVKHSVCFDFNKFEIRKVQQNALYEFTKFIDTTRVKSIRIFAYCDDGGKNTYNFDLSTIKFNTTKESLLYNGIKNKIIISTEGRGRILIDLDLEFNTLEARSENKSVNILVKFKPLDKKTTPSSFTILRKKVIIGDKIALDKVFFN